MTLYHNAIAPVPIGTTFVNSAGSARLNMTVVDPNSELFTYLPGIV